MHVIVRHWNVFVLFLFILLRRLLRPRMSVVMTPLQSAAWNVCSRLIPVPIGVPVPVPPLSVLLIPRPLHSRPGPIPLLRAGPYDLPRTGVLQCDPPPAEHDNVSLRARDRVRTSRRRRHVLPQRAIPCVVLVPRLSERSLGLRGHRASGWRRRGRRGARGHDGSLGRAPGKERGPLRARGDVVEGEVARGLVADVSRGGFGLLLRVPLAFATHRGCRRGRRGAGEGACALADGVDGVPGRVGEGRGRGERGRWRERGRGGGCR
ncbi:hypothetical protein BD310DRAFT_50113 [Dichomitus squalens]|uniref:Uncharacterized protein n=1 Tax=Dichomitus squalens TaxID=114155 RepID=A0A4Q9Q761_9APHY|nr:hypothetical protein BD310DRAFT_50113 [Dichomitus squalens]